MAHDVLRPGMLPSLDPCPGQLHPHLHLCIRIHSVARRRIFAPPYTLVLQKHSERLSAAEQRTRACARWHFCIMKKRFVCLARSHSQHPYQPVPACACPRVRTSLICRRRSRLGVYSIPSAFSARSSPSLLCPCFLACSRRSSSRTGLRLWVQAQDPRKILAYGSRAGTARPASARRRRRPSTYTCAGNGLRFARRTSPGTQNPTLR